MEFGPVFRALVHNRARFLLITLEVALTLAIVANCVTMVLDLRGKFLRESGFDETNLVVASLEPFSAAYDDENYLHAARARDLDRLRALPGVRDATAISAVPLSGGGSATGRKAESAKGDSITAPYFEVSDHAIPTLGVKLVAGRDFRPDEFRDYVDAEGEVHDQPAILSQALADKLFPKGDALGKRITSGGDAKSSNVVVGVVDTMFNSWPQVERISGHAMLLPSQPEDKRLIRYMIRTQPGARKAVMAGLEDLLLKADAGRIVKIRSLQEYKENTYNGERGLIKILGGVVVLLVAVTAFGIVGLTSFSVSQRRRQIGTRRALGATRQDILRYFLLENWLVTGSGLALGVFLAWALNYGLVKMTTVVGASALIPKLDWRLLAGGMLLLWGSGLLAALAPALRATRVAPVVATRTV
ncbi:MAG TPA: FtsX-like permease family protein [Thermoanaerobaculia bacterium]|jgi:putative ABC transport system permease protein|nr:FtsX-like permease family protein [Thermoanaerobaculia bacterium]